jgi:hypothetical protein
MDCYNNMIKALLVTCGHTQLPGRGFAVVGLFACLLGNPTRERPETATAHTANRCTQL